MIEEDNERRYARGPLALGLGIVLLWIGLLSLALGVGVVPHPEELVREQLKFGLIVAAAGMGFVWYSMMRGFTAGSSAPTVEVSPQDRISHVRRCLVETGRLLDELQDDLATRTRVLEQLEADAKYYERLASLNREQVEAIEGLIGRQFSRQQRISIGQQALFLALAFLLGFVVNWLSGPALGWVSHLF